MRLSKIYLRGHHLELFSHALRVPKYSLKLGSAKGFAHFFNEKLQLKKLLPRGYSKKQSEVIVTLINSLIDNPYQRILIIDGDDYICAFCPPSSEEYRKCQKNLLKNYDRFIAHMWGLKVGKEYSFKEIINNYYKPISHFYIFRHKFLVKVEYPIKEFIKGHLYN